MYVAFSSKFHVSKVKIGIYEYRNFTFIREMCFFAQRGFCTVEMNTEIPRWAANVVFYFTYVHMNTPPRAHLLSRADGAL